MPFTVQLSGSTELNDSLIQAFDQNFIVAYGQNNVMNALVQYKKQIGATSIKLPRFARIGSFTTPLDEYSDVTSTGLADTSVIITPSQYGGVVTTTELAELQSNGTANLAAAATVGISLGETEDKLALAALDLSSNVIVANGKTSSNILATDVANVAFLNKMYNALARTSVPKINDAYVMVAHDDVIADLRADTNAGSWTDVTKYSDPSQVINGEMGMFRGFRIVRDNFATRVGAGASSLVPMYNSYFLGFNGLGKAISQESHGTITGPYDKLARFVNFGWKGTFGYKIVEQQAVYVGQSASSVGSLS